MTKRRIKSAVIEAIGLRDEMPIDELRAVLFSTFSDPELMRRGAYSSGKKTQMRSAYIRGEDIDQESKCQLVKLGINAVIFDLRHRAKYLLFNRERGTVSVVRK